MPGIIRFPVRRRTIAAGIVLAAWSGLAAGEAPKVTSASDLGLAAGDVPVSVTAKIAYLVNPALNRKADLDRLLTASPRRDAPPPGWRTMAFDPAEVSALQASGRPGDTIAFEAVADPVESFFKFMFTQVPWTERSLQRIVEEVNREEFPLAAVDASPRIVTDAGGKTRWIETQVSLRLFLVHVESDRDRNLRWVSRCELFYEDSAVGRAPCTGTDPAAALSVSVLDAFRGKIALSFTRSPAVRRPSGKLDEPRRELIDRSISEKDLAAALAPAPAPAAVPPVPAGAGGAGTPTAPAGGEIR